MPRERTKTAQLNIRVEPKLKAAIEKAAAADQRSVASWVTILVSNHLAKTRK